MGLLQLAWLLALSACACNAHGWEPVVATREGLVRGLPTRSAAGNLFYSFKGIPYARAPVGALRFQPPQRHPGWSGVMDAFMHGSKCIQLNMLRLNTIEGEEDCLFANVYTPNLPEQSMRGAGLPVMVWIHGGGFVFGDGDDSLYGPKYLVDGGVVLVTFNYRLGVLGFFTTNDDVAPGNYGLRDQVMLLQWVQDNIAAFGGDPKLVTIFGESAGGASVSLLVLSPLTNGLFHHAISQSGAAGIDWAVSEKRLGMAHKFADKLNCTKASSAELAECIRGINATLILSQVDTADPWAWTFSARVDTDAPEPFLPDRPRRLLESGQFHLVPWMSGCVEEEAGEIAPMFKADEENFAKLVAGDLDAYAKTLAIPVDNKADAFECGVDPDSEIEKIVKFYTAEYGALTEDNLLPLVKMLSDRMFAIPVMEEIHLASAHTAVYKFVFDHRGPGRIYIEDVWPDFAMPGAEDFGVSHSEDLAYLFNMNTTGVYPSGSPKDTIIRFMVDVWTTFARTGRPGSSVLPMPHWPIYTQSTQRHMHLNDRPAVGQRLFGARVKFWNQVPVNDAWKTQVRNGACTTKEEL